MVPGTPRAVTPAQAEAILAAAEGARAGSSASSATRIRWQVAAAARALGLDAVQLHGDEDAAYIGACAPAPRRRPRSGRRCAVGAGALGARGRRRPHCCSTSSAASGGTGIAFDWARVARPRGARSAALLAGGLDPANAAAAARLGAYALDVGSGRRGGAGPEGSGTASPPFSRRCGCRCAGRLPC